MSEKKIKAYLAGKGHGNEIESESMKVIQNLHVRACRNAISLLLRFAATENQSKSIDEGFALRCRYHCPTPHFAIACRQRSPK